MSELWYDSIQTSTQMELMCREEPSIVSYNYGEDLQVLRERIAELEANNDALLTAGEAVIEKALKQEKELAELQAAMRWAIPLISGQRSIRKKLIEILKEQGNV